MKITLDMSISKLLDAFDREFGVSLGIYKGAHKSDNIKLFEISDPRKNQKAFIVINKDTSVESAEAMFRNTFGIRVQIKDRNGNTVSQESTLGGIRKLDKGFVDSNNENLTASGRVIPINLPAVIVAPERLTPGINATTCDNPMIIDSLYPISFIVDFSFPYLSDTHNIIPNTIIAVAIIFLLCNISIPAIVMIPPTIAIGINANNILVVNLMSLNVIISLTSLL